MATKVAKVGIKRKKGYLYYVDKKGNVVETKMARGKIGAHFAAGVLHWAARIGVERRIAACITE